MSHSSSRPSHCIFLTILIFALVPLAWIIPEEAAWENGLLEGVQVAILCGGFIFSCVIWNAHRHTQSFDLVETAIVRRLALSAMPIWLLCIGREVSWGATLFTQAVMDNEGPSFSAKLLWYYDAIKPMVLAVLALVALAFARWRLDRPLRMLIRQRLFPWVIFLFVAVGGLFAYAAERNLLAVFSDKNSFSLISEELAEIFCYIALVLFQSGVFYSLKNFRILDARD